MHLGLVALALYLAPLLTYGNTQTISVHGIKVEAKNISHFSGTDLIHSFEVAEPTAFPMANGSEFTAYETVYLHRSGNISAIVSSRPLEFRWKHPEGNDLLLSCAPKYNRELGQAINRMVAFHENRAYFRGCSLPESRAETFRLRGSAVKVAGDLDFGPSFDLLYAEKVVEGEISIANNPVRLLQNSSLSFFPGLRPAFFTPAEGETFSLQAPGYGTLKLVQPHGKKAAVQLFENGELERGIIAEKILHNELGFPIPAGSGVMFTETRENKILLTGILHLEPLEYRAKGHSMKVSSFSWDTDKGYYNVTVAEPFLFHVPESEDLISVPAGSIVGLDKEWTIIGIRIPNR